VAVEKKRFHSPHPDPLPAHSRTWGTRRSPLTVDAATSNTSHARVGTQGSARKGRHARVGTQGLAARIGPRGLGERAICVLPVMLCTAGRALARSPARESLICGPDCIVSR